METTIEEILKNDVSEEYKEIKNFKINNKKDIEILLNIIKNIKKEYLYKSKIHGFNHSVKVMIFTYLIAKSECLNEVDMKIAIDAALYHDIGRQTDSEDTVHGLSGAYLIEQTDIVKDRIYQDNQENLNLLKAIIDGHSRPDKDKEKIALNNEITNMNRYSKLYDILKDADALDRKRFREGYNFSLDPKFLRIKKSGDLIKLSEEINYILKKEYENIIPNIKTDELEKDCLHSIGFDFFKLNMILKYGILSKSKMKELNLNVPTNFEGGNLDNWISVVDGNLVKENYSGMREFIRNGISFYATTNYLEKGLGTQKQNEALEKGLPYNKGLHSDERYVYKEIPTSNILAILIPENYKYSDISTLSYIYNSLSIDLLKSKIIYYYEKVNEVPTIKFSEIIPPLKDYEKSLEQYHSLYGEEERKMRETLPKVLEEKRIKINAVIQQWIKRYYAAKLNKNENDKICVLDVVQEELKLCNLDYNCVNGECEVIIFLNNNLKLNDSKQDNDTKHL